MKYKNFLIGLIAIIAVFLSYFYIKPINKSLLSKDNFIYSVKNVNNENNLSAFINEGKGNFYIHPGLKKAVGVTFVFKKDGNLKLFFFLSSKSIDGNVKFTIIKNNKIIKIINIKSKKTKEIKLKIKKNDTLTIWANKNGNIKDDIAYFNISYTQSQYKLKKFIIPLLWSLLFIFLLSKNYKYIALNTYIGFLLIIIAEKLNFGYLMFKSIITYTIFLFAISFLFVFIYQELEKFKKLKIATILSYIATFLIYIVPLSMIIYALNYNTPFSRDALFAVFQSNSKESLDYISDFISIKYIILFIIITIFLGIILYIQEKKETNKIERSLLLFLIIVFTSIASIEFSSLRLPFFIVNGFKIYTYEIEQFKEVQKKRKAGKIKFNATKKANGETYIFIIGESLNKKHMGVCGYFRNTTPNLTKMYKNNELVLFNNVYSNHTHTVFVLDLALTEANQYNNKKFFNSVSIIDVLKKAGFETYWLTNQPLYSIYDNMVSVIATSADHIVALNTSVGGIPGKNRHYYDGPLIDRVKKVLSHKTNKNRAIFVHLGGSHTTYTDRYPNDKFTIYSGNLDQGEFGSKASKVENLNSYDNSVYYNDYVVSSIIKEFKKDKSAYALFYMSDHTDDVIDKVAHNSSMFTYYMTQIPFIAWFSEKYKKKYPDRYKTLINHKNTLFSNDMLYDTLIGIYGIYTNKYNAKYDFSSPKYKLNPKDALVLHGKKHYTNQENHIYWQKNNKKILSHTNKAYISSVDTTGELNELQNSKFKSFEIDILLKNNILKVAKNNKLIGYTLNKFLKKSNISKINNLIFTIHNIDTNCNLILNNLDNLNKKYNFKDKSLLNFLNDDKCIKKFIRNGWKVSYKVENNITIDKNYLNKTLNIIKDNKLNYITFNSDIYDWIKKHLASNDNLNINYVIYFNTALYNKNFKHNLIKSKMLNNNKIKAIIFKYDSQFQL